MFLQAESGDIDPDDLHEQLEKASGLTLIGRENEFYGDYVSAERPVDAILVVRNTVPPFEDEPVFSDHTLNRTLVLLELEQLSPGVVERVRRLPGLRYVGMEE